MYINKIAINKDDWLQLFHINQSRQIHIINIKYTNGLWILELLFKNDIVLKI